MKKIIFFFALSFLLTLVGYLVYRQLRPNRVQYRAEKHQPLSPQAYPMTTLVKTEKFSAYFPQNPNMMTKNLPVDNNGQTLPYREYSCVTDQRVGFFAGHVTLPKQWCQYGDKLILKQALKIMMKTLSGQRLVGSTSSIFSTFPALDYEYCGRQYETSGILILVDHVIYKVEVTYPLHMHDKMHDTVVQFITTFTPIIRSAQDGGASSLDDHPSSAILSDQTQQMADLCESPIANPEAANSGTANPGTANPGTALWDCKLWDCKLWDCKLWDLTLGVFCASK